MSAYVWCQGDCVCVCVIWISKLRVWWCWLFIYNIVHKRYKYIRGLIYKRHTMRIFKSTELNCTAKYRSQVKHMHVILCIVFAFRGSIQKCKSRCCCCCWPNLISSIANDTTLIAEWNPRMAQREDMIDGRVELSELNGDREGTANSGHKVSVIEDTPQLYIKKS